MSSIRPIKCQNPADVARIDRIALDLLTVLHTGKTIDSIFESIFDELKSVIPYDRIGLSMLENNGQRITEYKVKSDSPVELGIGYSCDMDYTTLGKLLDENAMVNNEYMFLEGGKRRIIYDLPGYVKASGRSTVYNTKLIGEGLRSSLTVPLYIGGKPEAFIFFSSKEPNAYSREKMGGKFDVCIALLDAIQPHLALAVEKGTTITLLQETNSRLNDLLRMKDDFLSIASHDLRSPLTSIIGFGRYITGHSQITESQRKMLETMTNSAGHLLMLVDDMMSLAKANAGGMELTLKPDNLNRVLDQSLSAMAFNTHNRSIDIALEKAECPDVLVDASKMFQVFNNLIGNAIKFSPEGGRISLKETVKDGAYTFSVADAGPGISKEDQKKLFGRFVQVGNDLAARQLGTGLGLMICQMILEKHGGKVWVDSEPGKGSTFSFTIPLIQQAK